MIARLAGPVAWKAGDAIARILALSFTAPEQRWSAEGVAGTLAVPGTVAFVSPDPGAPHGCALLRVVADEAEILTLAVLPTARQRGMARRLIAACLAEAAEADVIRVYLEVGANNSAARALYRSAGFVETGQRAGYYRGASGREDAILMAHRPGSARTGHVF